MGDCVVLMITQPEDSWLGGMGVGASSRMVNKQGKTVARRWFMA